MTSYIIDVKRCLNCNSKFGHIASASYNTFGATFYTDGYVYGPMYDSGSALVVCPTCKKYIWLKEIPNEESIYEMFWSSDRNSFPISEFIMLSDYEEMLDLDLWKNADQEKYIRVRAWWSFNNKWRFKNFEKFSMSSKESKNLWSLLNLFDKQLSEEIIMKAEIYRELGRFEECLKLLEQSFDDDYLQAIKTISKLAKCKNRQVAEVR